MRHPKAEENRLKEEFFEYCSIVGVLGINIKAYSEKSTVTRRTIKNWYAEYVKKNGIPDLTLLSKEFALQGMAAIRRLSQLCIHKDERISLMACKTLLDSSAKYLEVLEKLGLKEVYDKPEIEAKVLIEQTNLSILTDTLTSKQKDMLIEHAKEGKIGQPN